MLIQVMSENPLLPQVPHFQPGFGAFSVLCGVWPKGRGSGLGRRAWSEDEGAWSKVNGWGLGLGRGRRSRPIGCLRGRGHRQEGTGVV